MILNSSKLNNLESYDFYGADMVRDNSFLELGYHVFQLRAKMSEAVGKEYSLSAVEVEILAFLDKFSEEDTTATEIERHRNIKKNTISVHVENLVQRGLVTRRELCGDRRKIGLALTDDAREIVDNYRRECDLLGKKLCEGLSEGESKTVKHCFCIVNDNAMAILKG